MGTKLSHLPDRHELKRLRERWDREDADDIPLKDFDTTLTSTIDDTITHLALSVSNSRKSHESEKLQLQAAEELKTEIIALRKAHATTVEALNRKASRSLLAAFETKLTARVEKRMDNLFKLVGFLGVAIGVIVAVKGH